jgi:cysteine desulfurase / selenocysteine lyase
MIETKKYDVLSIRKDFPNLNVKVHDRDLVYFDNAATTHKPLSVIEKTDEYYRVMNSNVHRGVHALSQLASKEYEDVREKVRSFINANSLSEIIFTAGTTAGINLVASSFGRKFIKEGDEIIITEMEHHSNIVPWQILREQTGAVLKVIPINDNGEISLEDFDHLISPKTKLVSVVHISNALGTINPIKQIIEISHEHGIPVLIDAAQSIQHVKIDVKELDYDFLVFSGHKIYGPTGTGILYGKEKLLNVMPPYQGGGDMITSVTFEKTVYNSLPYKFEAGTPNIAGVIALGTALDYVNSIGIEAIHAYESELSIYTLKELQKIEKLRLIGTAKERIGVFSFVLENVHPHDIGTILDFEGIAVRTGHHCAHPVMQHFKVPATARLSLAMYNTKDEMDYFVRSIKKVFEVFN